MESLDQQKMLWSELYADPCNNLHCALEGLDLTSTVLPEASTLPECQDKQPGRGPIECHALGVLSQ